MAHEFESGFLVRTPAWHKLGTVIGEAPSIEEGIKLAGLDWKVGTRPLWAGQYSDYNGAPTIDAPSFIPSHKAVCRLSDNRLLGVVGKDYHVLQNTEAFQFFQPFVDSGQVQLETAGSLRNGKKVWILATVPTAEADVVKGDRVKGYLLLSNSHDASQAVRVQFTTVRVVCANTLSQAERDAEDGRSRFLNVRHDKNLVVSLAEVQKCVDIAERTFKISVDRFRALADRGINVTQLEQYVREVFEYDTRLDKMPQCWDYIATVFERGPGVGAIPGVSGTWWAAYNAVTDWIDHGPGRGRNDESRLHSSWFGNGSLLRSRALAIASSNAVVQ